jgi:hypothetical protein
MIWFVKAGTESPVPFRNKFVEFRTVKDFIFTRFPSRNWWEVISTKLKGVKICTINY